MGIHEDARNGSLLRDTLNRYLSNNPKILDEQDPATGYAPLATASIAGFPDVVEQLLNKGAKADALSRNNETALLLTTRDSTSGNRARIVQLLLTKMSYDLIDATTAADRNNTPLMFAVRRKDINSVRELIKAGASSTAPNDDDETPETAAASDKGMKGALQPDEQSYLQLMADMAGGILLYIVSWFNKTADNVMEKLFGLKPAMNENIDENVNDEEAPHPLEFLENIDDFLARDENAVMSRFFKDDPSYIQDLAKRASQLGDDPLGRPDQLPMMIKVTLHQQVIYCDDSSSMKRDGRWAAQAELVQRITRISTRVLPDGEGVALRFINQDPGNLDKLSFQDIRQTMEKLSPQPRGSGDTAIGTYLRSRILEPMIYSELDRRTLAKPYLISVMTDGMPSAEPVEAFVDAIKECGLKLQQAGYPRKSVRFLIGQIGTGKAAAKFLEGIGSNKDIEDMVYVVSDQLDQRFSAFKEREGELDVWLLKTLYEPIKN